MRFAIVLAFALALAGCGGSQGGTQSEGEPPAPETPAGQSLTVAGCPIDEAAFCERAAQAGNALVARDIERLVGLSRVERFSCTTMPVDLFPQCKSRPAVQGYSTFDGRFEFLLVGRKAYSSHIREILRATDLEIQGVGTCGPDVPENRSYHLFFSADRGGEPWLGSLEFVFRDGAWWIGVFYVDTVQAWRKEYADPVEEMGCSNVQPWGV